NYALAYAGLADCCGQLMQWTSEDPETATRQGLEYARKAIALNPRLPEAYKAEALVLGFANRREESIASLRKAIEVDPRYTPALGNLAAELFRMGNLAGAERLTRRAIEIDPNYAHMFTWLAAILLTTSRLDEASEAVRRSRALSSEQFYVTTAHIFF